MSMPFPEEGLVYDYKLEDGGVNQTHKEGDEDEDEDKKSRKRVLLSIILYTVHKIRLGLVVQYSNI